MLYVSLFVLIVGILYFGWIISKLAFSRKPFVIFGKAVFPIENKSYVCVGNSCLILPRKSEFIVIINESVNCSRNLLVYPYKPLIYGVYCKNSTMYKAITNISDILYR